MNHKRLWLIPLFTLVLTVLSCTLQSNDSGDIELQLPSYRTTRNFESSYEITLTNSSGIEEVYRTTKTYITIPKVKFGKYKISVLAAEPTNSYYGEEEIVVRSKSNSATVKLEAVYLQKITAKPRSNCTEKYKDYVPYGKQIDITSFIITEDYGHGLTTDTQNYSKYELSNKDIIKELKDIPVTITRKGTDISSTTSIPCRFTIAQPSLTLDAKDCNVNKGETYTVNATLSLDRTNMPIDSYDIAYKWEKKGPTDSSFVKIPSATSSSFNVYTNEIGSTSYKCSVNVTPKEQYEKYCTSGGMEHTTAPFTITVVDSGSGGSEAKLRSIEITPKADAYVLYNNKIKIESFDITEHFDNQTTQKVSDYSNYVISPTEPILLAGETPVTISVTHNNSIKAESTIPCKFNLVSPTVSLDEKGPISLTQGDTASLTASINYPSSMPTNGYTEKYEWLKRTTSNGFNKVGTDYTFNIPTETVGSESYKFKVTISVNQEFSNYCLNGTTPINVDTNEVSVTVVKKGDSGGTPSDDLEYLTSDDLQKVINSVDYTNTITLNKNYLITKTITISSQPLTIIASEPIVIKRGNNFKDSLFDTKDQNGSKLKFGNNNSALITLDGGSTVQPVAPIFTINQVGSLELYNCIVQNNYSSTNGGAIYSNGTINIQNCTIKNNKTDQHGGAIYIYNGSQNIISGTTIENNSAKKGGAIAVENSNPSVEITGSTKITNNTASVTGGGIYITGGTINFTSGSINNNKLTTNGQGKNLSIEAGNSQAKFNGTTVQGNKTYYEDNSISAPPAP